MGAVIEIEGTTSPARALVAANVAGAEVPGNAATNTPPGIAISDTIQSPKPKLESGRHLILHLGLSFALLIVSLFALSLWVNNRVIRTDLDMQGIARRTAKLQLAFQALHYSNTNSRITMQILLQKGVSPELLARRAENSENITKLISALEPQCDSEKEKQLLLAVSQGRTTYRDNYQRALKLLFEDKNAAAANAVMLEKATPSLFAYHAAWHEFLGFEMEQMTTTAKLARERSLKSRRIGLTLQWLAAFLIAAIAVFTTSRMSRDIRLRTRMQEKLSRLNADLERKVAVRTEELGRAEQQLRESLLQSQKYAAEIEAVNELAKLLQSCLTLEEAQQQTSWVLGRFFPSGTVLMLNSSRNLLDVAFRWGAAASSQGPFPPESCWALRKGQHHLAGPHCHNPVCSHSDDTAGGCHLCIPMMAQGGSLGILSIDDPSFCGGDPTSEAAQAKIKLASTLAEQLSLAFANLMLRETLKYQSVRDPLTGLFNRRHMEEALERELLRAARKATPVTVLMIDIDHFKRFNDMFGHEAGDLLLRELGSLFKSQIRGGDIACRHGGEEFLLIMGETDVAMACQRAENLREQFAALPVRYRGEMLPRITVSIGVAGFPTHGESASEIVGAADGALYRAKHAGRDRVVVAE